MKIARMGEKKEKFCNGCKTLKLINEFGKDKHMSDGYTCRCKLCRNEASYKWNRANKEKVKEANLKNREKRKEFYDSEKGIISSRSAHLKRMYKITLEDYEKLSEEQNHVCFICGKGEMNNKNKVLCVDHNHETGKVRGLLCGRCNSALGQLDENINNLLRMVEYIEKYNN